MRTTDPKILLGVGFLLLVIGVVLPILMVMAIIPSTLFLSFFSYAASFVGVIVGFIGAFSIVIRSRNRRRDR